nr:hypothetical protein [Candidatus Cloacimonadota bacterium]
MKKIFLILVLFVIFGQLISLEFSEIDNSFQVSGSFEIEMIQAEQIDEVVYDRIIISDCESSMISNLFALPVYTKLVALPATGNYSNTNFKYNFDEIVLSNKIAPVEYNDQAALYTQDEWFPQDIITIAKPVIMRGNRFSQVSISPVQYNPKKNIVRILKDIDLNFEIDQSDSRNPLTREIASSHFSKIANEKILGAENPRNSTGGEYLFIAPN